MKEAMVGDLVNLKRFRKRVAREADAQQAEANRARFGRTKAEKTLAAQRASRAEEILNQHRLDDEEAS
jgi:hypothetical protein